MSLWIANRRVELVGDCSPDQLLDFIVQDARVRQSAARLLQTTGTTPIPNKLSSVYVFQREWAPVLGNGPLLVGSDAATTCHILILYSPQITFVTHLDGSPEQTSSFFWYAWQTVRNLNVFIEKFEVYLAGGFEDEKGTSRDLGREILWELYHGDELFPGTRFQLKLCCIGPLNTLPGEIPLPAVRALALELPGKILRINTRFADRGPGALHRSAFSLLGCSLLANARDWDPECPQRSHPLPAWQMELIEALVNLSDQEILQKISTSPQAEHPEFCEEIRQALRYLQSYQATPSQVL